MTILKSALKEWQIAVDALVQGTTILLLRKGGIREQGGRFRVASDRVLLYPTYEHQQSSLLKPTYAAAVETVPVSGWHPDQVAIVAWAEITEVLQVTQAAELEALLPFHIWNAQFASQRFAWKPREPLYLLLLRTFRLAQPQVIPYDASYGGCRSWIELQEAIAINQSCPVLGELEYQKQVQSIHHSLGLASRE